LDAPGLQIAAEPTTARGFVAEANAPFRTSGVVLAGDPAVAEHANSGAARGRGLTKHSLRADGGWLIGLETLETADELASEHGEGGDDRPEPKGDAMHG
jgi:hypothetical protein